MARSSSGGAILATVVTLVILLAGVNYLTAGQVTQTLFPGATIAVDGVYAGPVTPRMSHVDGINSATTYSEGGSTHTRWLRCTGCNGVPTTGYQVLTTGNNSFSTLREDNGVVFAEMQPVENANIYLAVRETLNSNPGIIEAIGYVDYDNDAVKEMVARINYVGIGLSAGQTTLDLPVNGVWFAMASSFTGAVQEPGAFLVNVGTSQNNTQVYRYRFTFTNFDRAVLLKEMHIRYNTSDTGLFTIDKIEIPVYNSDTGGFTTREFTQQDADEVVLSTNSTYKYFFAGDLSGIQNGNTILASRTGSTKYLDIIIHTTWTLGAGDSLTQAVELKWWDDSEITQRSIAEIAQHQAGPMD